MSLAWGQSDRSRHDSNEEQALLKHMMSSKRFWRQATALRGMMLIVSAWGVGLAQTSRAGATARAGQAELTSLPSGTALFIRLDTAVSTASSHLHAPISAHVVREVVCARGVAIPLGAVVRGNIEKLIPASAPSDRARLLLRFGALEVPGQPPLKLAAHVTEVENSRETVKADGTIEGVLAKEVPLTFLDVIMGKMGQMGDVAREEKAKYLGNTDTAIEVPAGIDIALTLDAPLEVRGSFPSAVGGELPSDVRSVVNRILADAPQRAQSKAGKPGDPLNVIFVGSEAEIRRAFQQAGWTAPQTSSRSSISRSARAAAGDQGYGEAPLSDLYLYGKREELAFEKMFDTISKRHHLRLWQSPGQTRDRRPIWLAAATHDTGIDIHPGVISHAIDPNLDLEREKVGADLIAGGSVTAAQLITPPNPLREGMTATGGTWKTDGQIRVVVLRPIGLESPRAEP